MLRLACGLAMISSCIACRPFGPGSASTPQPPTTVFIVHGTYDGTGDWCREVVGKVTFASELRRGFGGSRCRVVPHLWRTTIHHEGREQAARSLAKEIDDAKYERDRIILVGHSHGGNVCLAAAGKCRRRVRSVILLATPNVHVLHKTDEGRRLYLPLYCSPRAFGNIDRIVNVQAQNDQVVNLWAKLRKGIDERSAVEEVAAWRSRLNHPRLADDGDAIREVLEDVFHVKLATSLHVSPGLSVAHNNIVLGCDVGGGQAHGAVHSCRVGESLGRAIGEGLDAPSLTQLASLVIPSSADHGGPLGRDAYAASQRRRGLALQRSGWLLTGVSISDIPENRPDGRKWDANNSRPDIYLVVKDRIRPDKKTDHRQDSRSPKLRPFIHFVNDRATTIEVMDKDVAFPDKMCTFDITCSANRPPPTTLRHPACTLHLTWKPAHY